MCLLQGDPKALNEISDLIGLINIMIQLGLVFYFEGEASTKQQCLPLEEWKGALLQTHLEALINPIAI